LTRLGFFLLAHVLIDTRLIALALFKAVSEEGGVPLGRIQTLADEAAERTFGVHLDKVRADLSDENAQIAEELNKARNALLHWKRDRFSLPEYKGPTHFLTCVSAGREVTEFCSAPVGCDVQEVIAAGLRAAATGGRVALALDAAAI
jgi:hypothetical protein